MLDSPCPHLSSYNGGTGEDWMTVWSAFKHPGVGEIRFATWRSTSWEIFLSCKEHESSWRWARTHVGITRHTVKAGELEAGIVDRSQLEKHNIPPMILGNW